MSHSIVIQHPDKPTQLILLFHGVGATPRSLLPLGQCLAQALSHAMIVSVAAPYPFHMGMGYQWFPIEGVTETNRLARIQQAMPVFVDTVRSWQAQAQLDAHNTCLIGFSQGGIMALSSTQLEPSPLARQLFSLAGRFAEQPLLQPAHTSVHFLHGAVDPVITVDHAQAGEAWLKALGARTSLTIFEGLAHSVSQEMANAVLQQIQTDAG